MYTSFDRICVWGATVRSVGLARGHADSERETHSL